MKSRFVWFAVLVAMILGIGAAGAEPVAVDSTVVDQIVQLEALVDSLRSQLRSLDGELQQIKKDVAQSGEVDELIEALGETEDEQVPEEQRSRRSRVDALLKAITQRPGQLRFNGGATAVVQTLVSGRTRSVGTGALDIYASTSFGPGTLLFFNFEAIGGNGLAGDLPLVVPLNAGAGSTTDLRGMAYVAVREGWAEFTAFGDAVSVTAGKIDLTNYFDTNAMANDETAQFLSGAFVNNAALSAPVPSPGVRFRTVLLRRFSLQVGLASWDDAGRDLFTDLFTIASTGFKVFPESGWEGNLKIYAYFPPHVTGGTGWGLSLDQSAADLFEFFGRYGSNEQSIGLVHGVRSAWSAGAGLKTRIGGRRLAVAAALGSSRLVSDGHERIFEVYARWHFNTWIHLSPHLQLARGPITDEDWRTVIGLRCHFDF